MIEMNIENVFDRIEKKIARMIKIVEKIVQTDWHEYFFIISI